MLKKAPTALIATVLLGTAPAIATDATNHSATVESASAPATSGHVLAHGAVNSVNESDRTVNISHEPISALGWPSMTMDMKVSDDFTLSKVPVGKRVDFTMVRGGDGIYVVDTITAQ